MTFWFITAIVPLLLWVIATVLRLREKASVLCPTDLVGLLITLDFLAIVQPTELINNIAFKGDLEDLMMIVCTMILADIYLWYHCLNKMEPLLSQAHLGKIRFPLNRFLILTIFVSVMFTIHFGVYVGRIDI